MLPNLNLFQFNLPTYHIYLSLLASVTIFMAYKKALKLNYSTTVALDLSLLILITGFIGGRALHVLYENYSFYQNNPLQILFFWQGGFVFYGGALFAFIASYFYLWMAREPLNYWLDFFAPLAAFSYGFGRLSCFFAGCCYGETCSWPWAIQGKHPTQLYAFLWEAIVLAFILYLERKKKWPHKVPGQLFLVWLFLHSLGRIIMELFRDDFRGSYLIGYSLSTWLSVLFAVTALSLLIYFKYKRQMKTYK